MSNQNNNENEKLKLYIPMNVRNRVDFFPGFGAKEAREALTIFAFFIPVAIIAYIITGQSLPVVIALFGGGFLGVTFTTKDALNLSVLDYLKDSINFMNSQKNYKYKPKNEYE